MKKIVTEAKLLLIGIPVAIWTLLPIYNLFLFSISSKEDAFAGKLWPDHPTLRNFETVFREQHHFLGFFWLQMWNSLLIAVVSTPETFWMTGNVLGVDGGEDLVG